MVGNLTTASSSSDGEQFVIISARSSPDGNNLLALSMNSILRPYFIASHSVPDGTHVSQCAITASKFKKLLVYGHKNYSFDDNYGEGLKLDDFDAAAF